MSVREWGFDSYGMLLTQETMKYLASKICDDYTESEYDKEPYQFNEVVESVLDLIYVSDFSGDAVSLSDKTYASSLIESFYGDVIYLLPLDRCPSLFETASVYRDMNDIVTEMKLKAGIYLPSDFDYRGSICHIFGTYLG